MINDPVPVYIAEYQSLRSEALTHFTFANALVGLQVAAIGVPNHHSQLAYLGGGSSGSDFHYLVELS